MKNFFGFKTYREYLDSPHWKDKSQWIKEIRSIKKIENTDFKDSLGLPMTMEMPTNEWICDGCEKKVKRVQIHHLSYDCLGSERSEDLVLLCSSCHKKVHSGELKL